MIATLADRGSERIPQGEFRGLRQGVREYEKLGSVPRESDSVREAG